MKKSICTAFASIMTTALIASLLLNYALLTEALIKPEKDYLTQLHDYAAPVKGK